MIRISSYGEITRYDLSRTIAGRWNYWTSAYLVDGLLVDTGCAHTSAEFVAALVDKPVHQIVNTHSHEDHIGANGLMQSERGGVKIMAHPLALPVLADPRKKQALHPYRQVFWGWPEASSGEAIQDGAMVTTEHNNFQVIYTPGHSRDHICLYEPEHGWLFTGDLYVGGKERALRADYYIWEIIASLKKIAKLPSELLLPSCARIRQDPQRVLIEKVDYLESFGERVLQFHRQGKSVGVIVRELCGRPMPIELFTWGHFSRRQLVLSYLGIVAE